MTNPVVENLPRAGIRPNIDGRRRGVRDSLGNQTMGMTKTVARIISAKLR